MSPTVTVKKTKKGQWQWQIHDDGGPVARGHAPSEDAAKKAVLHQMSLRWPREET